MSAKEGQLRSDYRQTSGGYELVFSGVIFALVGLWLDRRFGTVPWFTIGLAVTGFIGALANVYYRYDQDMARHESEAAARRAGNIGSNNAGPDGGNGAAAS